MTSIDQLRTKIDDVFEKQNHFKQTVNRSTVKERKLKLKKLLDAILSKEEEIVEAIYKDYKKPFPESKVTEIFSVTNEIKHTIKKLNKWTKPQRVRTPLVFIGAKSEITYQPRGQVLIISPWNFPFLLAVGPLVSAIAAGNTVILKPSENSPNTTKFLIKFLGELFDEKEVAVFYGDHLVGDYLINLPFDHVFFTGSTQIGKIVMKAAAENLTPLTLELGGKSPAIVEKTADIKSTAERICWGKFMNSGQTCIAPDYLLVQNSVKEALLECIKFTIKKFYGDIEKISQNKDYSRIIDERHYNRLVELVEDAKNKGALSVNGNNSLNNENFIPPIILTDVNFEMGVMKEEIFGPVLPVIDYENDDEIFEILNKNPFPLAMYIFSKRKNFITKILSGFPSGGVMINNVVIHFTNNKIPFGGVGFSGLGSAHGFYGFKTFSHERAVMKQKYPSLLKVIYPPYTRFAKAVIKLLIKYF